MGFRERRVLLEITLRNAMLPVVTTMVLAYPSFLAARQSPRQCSRGPELAASASHAARTGDFPVIMGITLYRLGLGNRRQSVSRISAMSCSIPGCGCDDGLNEIDARQAAGVAPSPMLRAICDFSVIARGTSRLPCSSRLRLASPSGRSSTERSDQDQSSEHNGAVERFSSAGYRRELVAMCWRGSSRADGYHFSSAWRQCRSRSASACCWGRPRLFWRLGGPALVQVRRWGDGGSLFFLWLIFLTSVSADTPDDNPGDWLHLMDAHRANRAQRGPQGARARVRQRPPVRWAPRTSASFAPLLAASDLVDNRVFDARGRLCDPQ